MTETNPMPQLPLIVSITRCVNGYIVEAPQMDRGPATYVSALTSVSVFETMGALQEALPGLIASVPAKESSWRSDLQKAIRGEA